MTTPLPISIADGPLDVQLVDLNLALSPQYDPDFRIACVLAWIACGRHRGGDSPTLMTAGEDACWQLPLPLDEDARMRLVQIETVARDLYDVRDVRVAAEVDSLTEDLAALTVWAVAEQFAPGVRRVAVRRGYRVPVS